MQAFLKEGYLTRFLPAERELWDLVGHDVVGPCRSPGGVWNRRFGARDLSLASKALQGRPGSSKALQERPDSAFS